MKTEVNVLFEGCVVSIAMLDLVIVFQGQIFRAFIEKRTLFPMNINSDLSFRYT